MKSHKCGKPKIKIYFSMTDEDIKQAIEMDRDNFSNKYDLGVFSACKSWQNKNSEVYITAKFDDKLVGYINFLPLKEDTYEKYRQGLLHDSQLSGEDIETFKAGNKYSCLFCSIVIKKEYQKGLIAFRLLKALKQRLSDLRSRGVEVQRVLADCVTEDGINLATKLGFKKIYNQGNRSIYELNGSLLDLM